MPREAADLQTSERLLERLMACGADTQSGLTSHAPMAIEALIALGRADAAEAWLSSYVVELTPRAAPRAGLGERNWREALGDGTREPEWEHWFRAQFLEGDWRRPLQAWLARLAPGFCSDATHGVIRVSHAVRSLLALDSPLRRAELAAAFARWAASYQTLPQSPRGLGHTSSDGVASVWDAVQRLPLLPADQRTAASTIVGALKALDDFPDFAETVWRVFPQNGGESRFISDLTRAFARLFLVNAHDALSATIFTHTITAPSALRILGPFADPDTTVNLLRFAWQSSAALLVVFGRSIPDESGPVEGLDPSGAVSESDAPAAAMVGTRAALVQRAIDNGDEHVIKLAEVCLREYAFVPDRVYLSTIERVLALLPGRKGS